MARIARGTLSFEYNLDEEHYDKFDGMDQEEMTKALVEEMVEDVISQSYSDLGPCIEMVFLDRE
jgi:hypothetical protein